MHVDNNNFEIQKINKNSQALFDFEHFRMFEVLI